MPGTSRGDHLVVEAAKLQELVGAPTLVKNGLVKIGAFY